MTRTTMVVNPSSDLRAYGAFIQDDSARSLELLRQIESTVVALRTIRDRNVAFLREVNAFNEAVSSTPPVEAIDESTLVEFARAQDAIAGMHDVMTQKLKAAKQDRELRADDPVCPAYREAMESICELHEAIEALRWNILQFNVSLDASDPGRVLTTEKEIEDYLSSL